MQPNEHLPVQQMRIRPTRLVRHTHHFLSTTSAHIQGIQAGREDSSEVITQPTTALPSDHDIHFQLPMQAIIPHFPITTPAATVGASDEDDENDENITQATTRHLKRLSGMMRAVRLPASDAPLGAAQAEEGYWPEGIHQTGPLPIVNLYGREPFGRIVPPEDALASGAVLQDSVVVAAAPLWKRLLAHPATKVVLGLLVGVGLLFLMTKFVNVPATIIVLKTNLATPRGILLALLSGVAFLAAFSIRGVRWKLFLNPVGKISTGKAIQLFLVGIFLNFLLPVRGGEVAKSLMLKRIAGIPVSQSLPTVAMDKALDLLPALFIIVLVPLLGVKMSDTLWLVLGMVSGLLICLIAFVLLAAWKRALAIALLQKSTTLLPKRIGNKIEGFATGFVDSLLAGASQPRIFLPAILLTLVAVTCDGLFAMLAFWTIGWPISFGTAIFGYTVYNMFYILPTPPGQVGSNEITGLLVFHGLLQQPAAQVTAMFVFSHPWAALLMCVSGMLCLSALGLTISSAMQVQAPER